MRKHSRLSLLGWRLIAPATSLCNLLGGPAVFGNAKGAAVVSSRALSRAALASFLAGVFVISYAGWVFLNYGLIYTYGWAALGLNVAIAILLAAILLKIHPLTIYVTCGGCGRKVLAGAPLCFFRRCILGMRKCLHCAKILASDGTPLTARKIPIFRRAARQLMLVTLLSAISLAVGFFGASYLWRAVGTAMLNDTRETWMSLKKEWQSEPAGEVTKSTGESDAVRWIKAAVESIENREKDPDRKKEEGELASRVVIDSIDGKANRDDLAAAEKLVAKYEGGLDLLRKAAQSGVVDWGFGWEEVVDNELHAPDYRGYGFPARLVTCEAIVLAERGDADGAARAVRDGLFYAMSLSERKDLFSRTVSAHFLRRSLIAARYVLPVVEPSMAEELWVPCISHPARERFIESYVFELGFTLHWKELPDMGAVFGLPAWLVNPLYRPFWDIDRVKYARINFWLIDIFSRPYQDIRDEFIESFRLERAKLGTYGGFTFVVPSKVIRSMIETQLEADARMRLARLAIHAQQRKKALGRLPGSLKELEEGLHCPECVGDPFSGDKMVFTQLDDGIRIHSVGRDLMSDDSGEKRKLMRYSTERIWKDDDISWIVR